MKTIIERINESFTNEDRVKAAKKVEVLETGLFGIYHYKINGKEYKQKKLYSWQRFSPSVWVYISPSGRESIVPFKYVFYLTMKAAEMMPPNP